MIHESQLPLRAHHRTQSELLLCFELERGAIIGGGSNFEAMTTCGGGSRYGADLVTDPQAAYEAIVERVHMGLAGKLRCFLSTLKHIPEEQATRLRAVYGQRVPGLLFDAFGGAAYLIGRSDTARREFSRSHRARERFPEWAHRLAVRVAGKASVNQAGIRQRSQPVADSREHNIARAIRLETIGLVAEAVKAYAWQRRVER